jgi:hypothetical protein
MNIPRNQSLCFSPADSPAQRPDPSGTPEAKVFLLRVDRGKAFDDPRRAFLAHSTLLHAWAVRAAVTAILMGVLLIVIAMKALRPHYLFGTEAILTQGVYLERAIDDLQDEPLYYVAYEFLVGNQRCRGQQLISYEQYRRARSGSVVDLQYVASDPGISRIADSSSPDDAIFFGLVALYWNLGTWGLLLVLGVHDLRARRLARWGIPLEGEIVSVNSEMEALGTMLLEIEYAFIPPGGGNVFLGKEWARRRDLQAQDLPAKGNTVAVLYAHKRHYRLL